MKVKYGIAAFTREYDLEVNKFMRNNLSSYETREEALEALKKVGEDPAIKIPKELRFLTIEERFYFEGKK